MPKVHVQLMYYPDLKFLLVSDEQKAAIYETLLGEGTVALILTTSNNGCVMSVYFFLKF